MAWRCHGTSNATLVEQLWYYKILKSDSAKAAFLAVDRAHYSPNQPYQDSPQTIGHRATISAPHMHAKAVESLLPFILPASSLDHKTRGKPGRPRRILDIGSGSGYLTAVFSELATQTIAAGGAPIVVGLEHIGALRDLGERNMRKSCRGKELLDGGIVRLRLGDGRKGWVEEGEEDGGWDAIHVGAGAVKLHEELVTQLRSPGRMFIPVDEPSGNGQCIWEVDKDEEGNVTKTRCDLVRYVPLTDAPY